MRLRAIAALLLLTSCAAATVDDPTTLDANDAGASATRATVSDASSVVARDAAAAADGASVAPTDSGASTPVGTTGPVGTMGSVGGPVGGPVGNDAGSTTPDSGASSGPLRDASTTSGPDPLNASAKCTSGQVWSGVTDQTMRPGESCPTCHTNFELAGTLYPTGHEPNDCDGANGITLGVTVVVTDATGQDFTLFPNQVGNFYTSIQIKTPFQAKVVVNGVERAMQTPQTSGACNGCHTQTGANGAPGRITLPE